MTEVIPEYKTLQENKEFLRWSKEHKGYLSHIFSFLDENKEYQIGFCDEKGDSITVFTIVGDSVKKGKAEEIFKQPDSKVLPLDIDEVSIGFDEAVNIARGFHETNHDGHLISKQIVILQHLEIGQVYNITFVTQTFKTSNIKVDADNGKILEDKFSSLFDIVKEQHGKDTSYIG